MNVEPEIIKLLERSIEESSLTLALEIICLKLTPKAKATKEKINKGYYIKLKIPCAAKENINKIKRQPTGRKKVFVNHISDKEFNIQNT